LRLLIHIFIFIFKLKVYFTKVEMISTLVCNFSFQAFAEASSNSTGVASFLQNV